MNGPARRKKRNQLKANGREPSAETFSVKTDLYLDTTDEKVIKEKVMEKAKELSVKNATTLADANNDLYACLLYTSKWRRNSLVMIYSLNS